jgi:hypothetical protein
MDLEGDIFSGLEGEPGELVVGDDPLRAPLPRGQGYELSFMHHKDPTMHSKPYFFTTQLGSPFPSYHSNPLPNFPARWCSIPNVRPPCESLTAPRIRLAPIELGKHINVLEKMTNAAASEGSQPHTRTLNLSHQALGDPYQAAALRAFVSLNRYIDTLNLNDNELEDILDLDLSEVRCLHLSHNNFVSFDGIPPLPKCEILHLKDNFLSGYSGLTKSKFPRLRYLTIDLNPIEHDPKLWDRLRDHIPTLEVRQELINH